MYIYIACTAAAVLYNSEQHRCVILQSLQRCSVFLFLCVLHVCIALCCILLQCAIVILSCLL